MLNYQSGLSFLGIIVAAFLASAQAQEVVVQTSTIDALLNGVYDGETTVAEVLAWGDIGLGTFNALDGEMVVVDGECYQIDASGKCNRMKPTDHTPFAATTRFDCDIQVQLPSGTTYEQAKTLLDTKIASENLFYAVRIDGTFKHMKTRSVPRQQKPYQPLAEVVKQQPIFEMENIKGTIVGFRCPPFTKGINVPGYHLHFISDDRSCGGHILDFTVESAAGALDETRGFTMILPENEDFIATNLNQDQSQELKSVEHGD